TIYLSIGVFLALLMFISAYYQNFKFSGNHEGYEPVQPISFSHRLHAGELGVDCLFCHFGAAKSKHAGIPPTNVCLNCHKFITAPFVNVKAENDSADAQQRKPNLIVSGEIKKIYDAMGLNNERLKDETKHPMPIEWLKVHNLPDFVYFDHRPHVAAGVQCQTCHGAIETMERVRQVNDLSMGWCVNCHRDSNRDGLNGIKVRASTDCVACHY
ncbi:MAG: cytochrome c3 family protein, partial [Ignavibacteria bacterium]|nr:cytochrome c3 family protein [Ignavibacteria bacterium]